MSGVFHTPVELYKDCPNSDQAKYANKTKKQIDADQSRRYRYYAIVVKGCKLDNSIFSSEGENGLVNPTVKFVAFNKNGFDMKSAVVEWNIAFQGPGLEKLTAEESNPFANYQAAWNA